MVKELTISILRFKNVDNKNTNFVIFYTITLIMKRRSELDTAYS